MARKYRLSTLGCKVNQYESQQIRELLESLGLVPAGPDETPDVTVVNTCAVTLGAARKSRQAIRRMVRDGEAVFVVGCGVSADAEQLSRIDGVVATVGHDVDICAQLLPLIAAYLQQAPPRSNDETVTLGHKARQRPGANGDDVWMRPVSSGDQARTAARRTIRPSVNKILSRSLPIVKAEEVPNDRAQSFNAAEPRPLARAELPTRSCHTIAPGHLVGRIGRFAGHQRAFLKVQDGCDASCTYCIIPRLRPRLAFKPIETAVAEASDLVRAGHKEIVVTGIFLGAYGRDTTVRRRFDKTSSPLAELIAALARVDGLERVRLSSLEPGDVDNALLEVLASHANCVPHLHLPLQSGSAEILRRMNRQYTRDEFLDMVDRVRSALDRPAITTDIIVGFPGETDEDFEASVEVARCAWFARIHAFPFSPRAGTAATRWRERFVQRSVVRERMNRLAEVGRECSLAFRRRALGSIERVLVEGKADPFRSTLSASRAIPVSVFRAAGFSPRGFTQACPSSSTGITAHNNGICFDGTVRGGLQAPGFTGKMPVPHSSSTSKSEEPEPGFTGKMPVPQGVLLDGISLNTTGHGRTDRYFEVHFEAADHVQIGDLVSVRIDRVTTTATYGTHIVTRSDRDRSPVLPT